jgi:hypothetical protein
METTMKSGGSWAPWRPTAVVAAATMACMAAGPVLAVDIDTGNPDFKLRWDNTVKYSAAYRLHDASATLLSDPNQDDGDANFRKPGFISNRLDLLSEMEGSTGDYGFRISGAGWYDSVYNRANENNTAGEFGPGTSGVNSSEISSPTQFTPYTRRINGKEAELLDAFVSAKFDLGGHAATVRLGQHSLVWGETLFFGDNGIAGAMSPINVAKAVSVPNLRFQEILRPVPQMSGQFQIDSNITAYGYYQFHWLPSQGQGSGSYFSPLDFIPGGNLVLTPAGDYTRGATQDGKNSGQGGLSLRIRGDDIDYGLYAVRFNEKTPTTTLSPLTGTFYDHYHNGITTFGASANKSVGLFNFAAETSVRWNQDLLSPNAYDVGGGPQYAVGRTAHLNVSAFGSDLGKSSLWDDATLLAEVAYTRVLSITRNADTLSGCQPAAFPGSVCQPNGTRSAWKSQFLFEPVYYQALPGVDLRVPIGLSYVPKGSRNMVGAAPLAQDGGSFNIGVSTSYLDVWRAGLSVTHFFGASGVAYNTISAAGTSLLNYRQYFADRDYVALNITRTF